MASAALVLTALVVRGLDRRKPPDSARDEAPRPLGRSGARAAWVLFGVGTSSALAFGLGMGLLLGAGGLALGLFNLLLAVRKPTPGASLLAAAGLYALTGVLLAGLRQTVRATSAE